MSVTEVPAPGGLIGEAPPSPAGPVPDDLSLKAGTEVDVEVRNEGSDGHNFTIDELDLSTGTVEPGQVVTATFTVPNGTMEYH